jgi:hypothetical protein
LAAEIFAEIFAVDVLDLYSAFGQSVIQSKSFLESLNALARARCSFADAYCLSAAESLERLSISCKGVPKTSDFIPRDVRHALEKFQKNSPKESHDLRNESAESQSATSQSAASRFAADQSAEGELVEQESEKSKSEDWEVEAARNNNEKALSVDLSAFRCGLDNNGHLANDWEEFGSSDIGNIQRCKPYETEVTEKFDHFRPQSLSPSDSIKGKPKPALHSLHYRTRSHWCKPHLPQRRHDAGIQCAYALLHTLTPNIRTC